MRQSAVIGFQRPQRTKDRPFVPYRGPRDAFTGAPIERGAIVRQVTPDDRIDRRRTRVQQSDGWRTDVQRDITARPLRLHTTEVETTSPTDGANAADGLGSLGGHTYSRDMARYLQSGFDHSRADERADLWVWYRSQYGRDRAKAALIARYGASEGYLAYLAAWAYASGDMDADRIAAEAKHSVAWVAKVAKFARQSARPSVVTAPMTAPQMSAQMEAAHS